MPNFVKTGDGLNTLRPIQIEYLERLASKWDSTTVFAAQMQPGSGKSAIARTIQRTVPNTAIVTAQNILCDQYCDTYSELVPVKGMDYYDDVKEYKKARREALSSPAVFNPLSFYYFYLKNKKAITFPSTVVIDEAHTLGEMLLLTVNQALPIKSFGIPKDLTDKGFFAWLTTTVVKFESINHERLYDNEKLAATYERLKLLHEYLSTSLHRVKVFYEEREDWRGKKGWYLVVQPLVIPVDLMKTIFKDAKLVLLSGSLTQFHLNELFPSHSVDFVAYEHLAPKENRPIYYKPLPLEARRSPEAIAKTIRAIYETAGKPNTLVHVSYTKGKELAPFLKDIAILHEQDTKRSALEQFKRKGGLLLASGMAEGVDLPGDLCRLIIIPLILFPNKGDQAVIKRLALPNGQEWYGISAIMTTLQQVGRGVRSATDKCTTVVLDHYFMNLVRQTEMHLTDGFKESIIYENV